MKVQIRERGASSVKLKFLPGIPGPATEWRVNPTTFLVEYRPAGSGASWTEMLGGEYLGAASGQTINVLDYYQPTDSGMDAAISRAIAAGSARGGATVIIPNLGAEYPVTDSIVLRSNVRVRGEGKPRIKLANGVNKDVFVGLDTYTLMGTNVEGGITQWSIEGVTIDGNRVNQTAVDPDKCNGLSFYGRKFVLRDVDIVNSFGNGIRSEYYQYGETLGGMEANIDNVTIDRSHRHGWWTKGPHDINAHHLIIVDASYSADNTYCGVYQDGISSSGRFINFHHWHRGSTTNRSRFGFSSLGSNEIIASHLEGGRGQIEHRGSGDRVIGCLIYAHFGGDDSTMVLVTGGENQHIGCRYAMDEVRNAYGVQFGTVATGAYHNQILGGFFVGFLNRTPFNFVNDTGYNNIQARGRTTGTAGDVAYGGTKAGTTDIEYRQTGTVINTAAPASTVANLADGTTAGGNSRGNFTVDLQTHRFQANQVANGTDSVLAGGYANLVGGSFNVCGGGQQNSVTGTQNTVTGGTFHTADGTNNVISGGSGAATRSASGKSVFASGRFAVSGDAQLASHVLRRSTTDATATRLTTDGATAVAANSVPLPNNAAFDIHGTIIARDTTSNDTSAWTFEATIKRGASAAATALVGSATVTKTRNDTGAAAWTIAITADATNGCVAVTATGEAAKTIRWVCRLESIEVV